MIEVAIHQPAHAIDYSRIVRVIEELEGGSWSDPGGKLHFKIETWKEETKLPYRRACDPGLARVLACNRLGRLASVVTYAGYKVTPDLLLGLWLHGLNGALKRSDKPSGYMIRGVNLYRDPTFCPGLRSY